jgi:cbb3-type cytochrome oxidase maturation protein
MEVLYLLIPLAMIFVVFIGFLLFWAIRSGQYEDMEGPAHRILMDDDDPLIPGRDAPETDTSPQEPRPGSGPPSGR